MLRPLSVVLCGFIAAVVTGPVRAELITIDVNTNGTQFNRNVYGTTVTNGTATWPSNTAYRDYQFRLSTNSGTTTFDDFAVRLSASQKSNTATGNTLRASLWAGEIVTNPLLATALTTVTIPNGSVPTSGYTNVMLTGLGFTPQVIGTSPSVFFFRVWAEGNGSNTGGFNTKMADTLGELQAITMTESSRMNGDVALDTDNDGFEPGSGETYDGIQEVPEPSAIVLALAGVGLAGTAALRRRRS